MEWQLVLPSSYYLYFLLCISKLEEISKIKISVNPEVLTIWRPLTFHLPPSIHSVVEGLAGFPTVLNRDRFQWVGRYRKKAAKMVL